MTDTIKFKRPNLRRTRAFSLAELMIATGILGIGMIIVAMAFPVALDQSRLAVELSTSKLVYLDAVNTLKTRIKWTQLEQYINPGDGANEGALETTYRLGDLDTLATPRRIYLLSFDNVQTDDIATPGNDDFFPNLENVDCVYSADDTYGWVAAVQKIGNQSYKFWIFVLREPRGLDSVTNLQLSRLTNITAAPGKTVEFNSVNSAPARGEVLLDDTGTLYKVTDVGEPNGTDVTIMLDKAVQTVTPFYFTHVTGTGFTRKNPVLTVYQTVISY